MSKARDLRQENKTLLMQFFTRLQRYVRALVESGIDKDAAARKAKAMHRGHGSTSRAHWRRWYKANKKHQAQLRAIRQRGGSVHHMPHSLNAAWVP